MPAALLPAPHDPEKAHADRQAAKSNQSHPAQQSAPIIDRLLISSDDPQSKQRLADGRSIHAMEDDKIYGRKKDPSKREKCHERRRVGQRNTSVMGRESNLVANKSHHCHQSGQQKYDREIDDESTHSPPKTAVTWLRNGVAFRNDDARS